MQISGLQKMTLLDYPGKVACTVFLQACNFRCPFCHNSDLLTAAGEPVMTEEELLSFLRSRVGLLDAVCVTGGEPTLQPELAAFLRKIKTLGYPVKLDTNGARPDVLKQLVGEGLLDYVAMDVKNSPACYGQTTGLKETPLAALEESLRFLLEGHVDYELRTTVVAELHSAQSMLEMGQWLAGLVPGVLPEKLFLQTFVDRDSVLLGGLHAPEAAQMTQYRDLLAPYARQIALRG